MSNNYRSRQDRRKAQKKGGRKNRGLFKKVLLIFTIIFFLILAAGSAGVLAIIYNAPDLNPEMLDSPLSSTIYDKDNNAKVSLFQKENRTKIDIKNVPEKMKEAVISIEDRRFHDHFGIDIRRIVGAAITDIKKGRLAEGGSTITQQVVKRVALSSQKNFSRKIQEAYLAIKLEQKYSKNQILEMYLNKIFYGNQAYGIATASKTYFGTEVSDLNLSQMAILAGLPNAPATYDPFEHPKKSAQRRDEVLNAMVETNAISQKQADKAKSKAVKNLVVKKKQDNASESQRLYGGLIDQVYDELVNQKGVVSENEFYQGGLKIYTTMDAKAQKQVNHLLKSDEIPYPDENFEAGISLIDTQTGAVRAIGGGRDFTTVKSGLNYGGQAKNNPGSNIKPILDYGPAIEYLQWSTYHQLVDEQGYEYPNSDKVVHEWDDEYWGEMTARRALAQSRNVPAVKTLAEVGKDKAHGFAKNLGIDIKKPMTYSAALGSFDQGVAPLQMAGAFAAFGNQGVYHKPYTVRKVVFPDGKTIEWDHKPKDVMQDYTAYMITDMLKSVVHSGTGTMANISGLPVAGKTGSTQIPESLIDKYDIQENGITNSWFSGYTTQYSASIWTGYPSFTDDDGNPQFIHYGPSGQVGPDDLAKVIFKQLMSKVSTGDVSDFQMPDSVERLTVEKDSGKLASDNTPSDKKITELFVKENAPTETSHKYQKPDKPTNLETAYDQDDKQIKMSWKYKDDDNITYEIQQAIDNGDFEKIDTTDNKQFTVKNPDPGTTYRFKVIAIDEDTENQSDPAEAEVHIENEDQDKDEKGDEDQPPETPQQAKADYDKNNQQINVTWNGADKDHISYTVEQSINEGPFQPLQQTDNTQLSISDVKPGTRYRFRISAINTKNKAKSDPVMTNVINTKKKKTPENNKSADDNENHKENGNQENSGDRGDNQGKKNNEDNKNNEA